MSELIYPDESYAIIGACFSVYKEMGCGFLESVYQECLEIEFKNKNISYISQKDLGIRYKNIELQKKYKADFVCYNKIIVELKSVTALLDEHRAQLLNYLNATGYNLGLLINFGHYPMLEHERIAFTNKSRGVSTSI